MSDNEKTSFFKKNYDKILLTGTRVHIHHRVRKKKEEKLPPWKDKWNKFNEEKLGGLEKFVEKTIPWLVLLIVFILLGEFSHELNFFNWAFMERSAVFFHKHATTIRVIDQIVVSFFVVDLYFNFFKKASFWSFLKSSILDIIAIAPLGLMFRLARISETQSILHISVEVERGMTKLVKTEQLVRLSHLEKTARFTRLLRMFKLKRAKKIQDEQHKNEKDKKINKINFINNNLKKN